MDSTNPVPLTSEEIGELSDDVDCHEAIEAEHIGLLSQPGIRVHEMK